MILTVIKNKKQNFKTRIYFFFYIYDAHFFAGLSTHSSA